MTYKHKDYVHVCKIELDESEDCRFLIVYNLDGGNKNKQSFNPKVWDRCQTDKRFLWRGEVMAVLMSNTTIQEYPLSNIA